MACYWNCSPTDYSTVRFEHTPFEVAAADCKLGRYYEVRTAAAADCTFAAVAEARDYFVWGLS